MAAENSLWGQRRIRGELARLGFRVSARTVATYMRRPYDGVPSPSWREFLTRHAKDIWACDFFGVRMIFFQTLHVFFVMHHESRQILQARVTQQPTAEWAAQQDRGRVWLGAGPTAVSDPGPGRPVRDGVRSPRATSGRYRDPDPREGASGERARGAVGPIGEDRVSGSYAHHQRAPPAAGPGRVRRLLQCVASPSGVGPTSPLRIRSAGPAPPNRPDHGAAGARRAASCL
jgi:hypothetical protein